MKQRRIQPLGLGSRFSPHGGLDDHAAEFGITINFVVEMKHTPDHWRGSFAFYTNSASSSRDLFGNTAREAVTGLSLWRYTCASLADLN